MDSPSNRGGVPGARVRVLDRLVVLVGHPKRLTVAIVALLVAAGAAVGSSAVLTASSSNPGNSFHASNLDVTGDNGTVITTPSPGMHPGDNVSGSLTITNDGDLPASAMTLSSALVGDTAGPNGGHLASVLTATITDTTTGTQVYSGPATPMTGEPIALPGGTSGAPTTAWAAGEAHAYSIQLRFPNGGTPANNTSGDNQYQLSTASIQYTWKATQ
jgi:hypothetical protein